MRPIAIGIALFSLVLAAPTWAQPNNSCASPAQIGAGNAAFDTTLATLDGLEASCGFTGDSADVWFLYTSSQPGSVSISGTPGDGLTTFTVTLFSACGGPEVGCIGDVANEPPLIFSATAGQQFLVRVASYADFDERGLGTLDIQELGITAGDSCDAPIPTILGLFQWTNVGASTETTNSGCTEAGQADIWFEYFAESTGNTTIHTLGSLGDTILSVFPTCGGQPIVCSDDLFAGFTVAASRVCFPAVSGQRYLVRIATRGPTVTGNITIIEEPVSPTNDTCAGAIDVSIGSTPWNSVGACSSGPASACTIIASERTLWYRFTPAATGTVAISTCGAAGDSVVSVFAGACIGGEIECSDNVCGDDARAVVPVTADSPILIRIHSNYFSGSTSGMLTIEPVDAPVNDHCAGAIVIGAGSTPYDLANATTDLTRQEYVTCNGSRKVYSDLWFKYTAPSSGSINIDTCTPDEVPPMLLNTVLSVWAGCEFTGALACNDDSDTCLFADGTLGTGLRSRIIMDVTGGATYYLRVAKAYRETPGTLGQINIAFTGTGCPADFNGVGGVTIDDLFLYINAYFQGLPSADFNGAGGVTIDDLFLYINAYFVGC